MSALAEVYDRAAERRVHTGVPCYHCGIPCISDTIQCDDKTFCCEGCKLVYEVINNNGLCDYYKLQSHPGLSQVKRLRNDKFAFLDNEEIASQLYRFTNGDQTIAIFYIPNVHCASCMWLLEHLNRVNEGITESRLHFAAKEVTIHFSRKKVSIRQIAELLTTVGYEPYISLDDAQSKSTKSINKQRIIKLGVAGFCFGNIMMMSFPEYLSTKAGIDGQYTHLFRYLNLLLALPVFFYAASEFFVTAWKGLVQKVINIDAPIALAIVITFARSIYEIATGTGAGYLDSMSGIVFFMLAGRLLQERTYRFLSFTRDYKSYFPIAVNVVTANGVVSTRLQDLQEKDVVQLYNDEIIPADAVVLNGKARIDYSFVTGESEPVEIPQNGTVYAGGKQKGERLTIQLTKPVVGSYLTSLWNHYAFSKDKVEKNDRISAVHVLGKYFSIILFVLAIITAAYWYFHDPSKIINSVSAMLIVACPCALLLTVTFTNGNILRIFSQNGLYLRDASVIEQLGYIHQIIFDKTGTITQSASAQFTAAGHQLSGEEMDIVYNVIQNSKHPNAIALTQWMGNRKLLPVAGWKEIPGKGIDAICNNRRIIVGSAEFTGIPCHGAREDKATVYVRIEDKVTSFYHRPLFRKDVPGMVKALKKKFKLSLLSGDNDRQAAEVKQLFGSNSQLLFEQQPMDKLNYVAHLQHDGSHVLMIGDGLNDAGALQQSNVGITLADDINNFTPSCDAILDAAKLGKLPALLRMAVYTRLVIGVSFAISIVYNTIGLYYAMSGTLKPVSAAILMPCSTLSIVIITTGLSSLLALRLGLSLKEKQ